MHRHHPAIHYLVDACNHFPSVNAYALQLEDFCRVTRGVAPALVPLDDSIANALTTDALVSSLRQNRAVDVEPLDC